MSPYQIILLAPRVPADLSRHLNFEFHEVYRGSLRNNLVIFKLLKQFFQFLVLFQNFKQGTQSGFNFRSAVSIFD